MDAAMQNVPASQAAVPHVPIFDGHNDVLLKLARATPDEPRPFFQRSEQGHLDLPRAREGHMAGGLFAIFVPGVKEARPDPAEMEAMTLRTPELGLAQQVTLAGMARLFRLEAESAGQLRVTRTVGEIEDCLARGTLAAVMHIEGAEAIDPGLDALLVFYQAGLRSLGPVWSRSNVFGHGVPFRFGQSPDTGPGLTDAGKALVQACNELGVLVDLSHLNEKGFWDVAAVSDAPLVATHSSVHALCPSTRNLTDRQLDAIGERGGLVGINFDTGFVRADGANDPDTPLSDVVRHVDYVAQRLGVDHVALGSDFDGAMMPRELGDAAGLPRMMAALRAAGYDDTALAKAGHENWLRVLRATWKMA